MAAARFFALQGVHAHQLRELEEVGDAPGFLELLVELFARAGDEYVVMEFVPQVGNLAQRVLEALARPRHAAVLPHDPTELAVERICRTLALRIEELLRLLPDGIQR